jgi:hypothetical protein
LMDFYHKRSGLSIRNSGWVVPQAGPANPMGLGGGEEESSPLF